MNNDGDVLLIVFLVIITLVFSLIFGIGCAYMESTYNKLTGANTTWFDALWVELRVQDEPEKRNTER